MCYVVHIKNHWQLGIDGNICGIGEIGRHCRFKLCCFMRMGSTPISRTSSRDIMSTSFIFYYFKKLRVVKFPIAVGFRDHSSYAGIVHR